MSDIKNKLKYFLGLDDENSKEYESTEKDEAEEQYQDNSFVEGKTTKVTYGNFPESTSNYEQSSKENRRVNVVVYKPEAFEDTQKIIGSLKENKPVVINLIKLDKSLAQKIFNFCSGALYAIDGHMNQVEEGVFLLAPQGVEVTGDIKKELEESGVMNWIDEA